MKKSKKFWIGFWIICLLLFNVYTEIYEQKHPNKEAGDHTWLWVFYCMAFNVVLIVWVLFKIIPWFNSWLDNEAPPNPFKYPKEFKCECGAGGNRDCCNYKWCNIIREEKQK